MRTRTSTTTSAESTPRDLPAVKTVRFRIEGRVQGVGFRWWTRAQASALGLAGSVRNCNDGSVEVVAAGTNAALDSLRTLLHTGPPSAHVTSVTESSAPPPARASFEIGR
ncbi:MAG: acylphosphatase [Gemmatimonadota bacterium]